MSFAAALDQAAMSRPLGIARIGTAAPGKIGAETAETVLAHERETREATELEIPLGALERARRRFLVGVTVQDDREPRRGRHDGRSRQVVLDHCNVCAPTLEEFPDRPRLGEVAAEGDLRDGVDGDALERFVDRGTDDGRRAPMAAVTNEVAHAKLDRRRAFRPEDRIAQEDIGDGRTSGQFEAAPRQGSRRNSAHGRATRRLKARQSPDHATAATTPLSFEPGSLTATQRRRSLTKQKSAVNSTRTRLPSYVARTLGLLTSGGNAKRDIRSAPRSDCVVRRARV